LEGDGLADVDCVDEVDGEILPVFVISVVNVGKVLDEPLVKAVELGIDDTDIDDVPLSETDPLND